MKIMIGSECEAVVALAAAKRGNSIGRYPTRARHQPPTAGPTQASSDSRAAFNIEAAEISSKSQALILRNGFAAT
jgi:hypothetical protein